MTRPAPTPSVVERHSPGPWATDVVDMGYVPGSAYVTVRQEDGASLAYVLLTDRAGNSGEFPMEANARLIAEAPALLAACRELLAQADARPVIHPDEYAARQRARATIDRATGGK